MPTLLETKNSFKYSTFWLVFKYFLRKYYFFSTDICLVRGIEMKGCPAALSKSRKKECMYMHGYIYFSRNFSVEITLSREGWGVGRRKAEGEKRKKTRSTFPQQEQQMFVWDFQESSLCAIYYWGIKKIFFLLPFSPYLTFFSCYRNQIVSMWAGFFFFLKHDQMDQ